MQNKLLFYCTKKGDKNQIVKSTCYNKPFPFLINLCFLIFLLFFCFCFYYNVIGPTTSKSSIQCIKCFYAQNQLFINAKSSRPAKCVVNNQNTLLRKLCTAWFIKFIWELPKFYFKKKLIFAISQRRM